jgi:hypothetical protein
MDKEPENLKAPSDSGPTLSYQHAMWAAPKESSNLQMVCVHCDFSNQT